MFSDSRPREQKGFKPHAPHFIPWLRNSLKPHHSSDLGLNGPYKSSSDASKNLTPLEKAKGIGFFSKEKKGDLRCNGVGMARMLPVVLRGHHILSGTLGKQREESPAKWNQTPELQLEPNIDSRDGPKVLDKTSTSVQDNHTFDKNHGSILSLIQCQNEETTTSARKYGPLVGPPPTPVPALESNCEVPVVVCMEDKGGKVWNYSSHMYSHRDLHSSSWLGSDTQGVIKRQHGFSSNFSFIKHQSRNSQSHRDLSTLREPPVDSFNGPLNGLIFSTEVHHRGLGCSTTVRRPRKPRPSSERISSQSQTWLQQRTYSESEGIHQKEARCNRKVVRNQIKRVVDNLEQVLTALRDVQQEMKEVVHQIDYLTSSIDLNEDEQQQHGTRGGDDIKAHSSSSSSSGSSSSTRQRSAEPEDQPGSGVWRDHPTKSQSPSNVLLLPVERNQTPRFTCTVGSFPRQAANLLLSVSDKTSSPPQSQTSSEVTASPQMTLPVRPPTPGLSPLTVNLYHPNSPVSHPHSPRPFSSIRVSPISPQSPLFPKPHLPPSLSPSVSKESKLRSHQTPQGDPPSAGPVPATSTQPPSAICSPTNYQTQTVSNADRERRASLAGAHRPSQVYAPPPAAAAKPPTSQGRRGRKPPPYPHHRLSENTNKAKEPRKAPPYPEKRRLLSTTV
ncbi:protein enabled homolog [Sphaeramia orbicularis]|uniref:protein enabled homolog n=1 Tax=Sphaeramia orbicularis TaxID=375764 RepID=UPI00117F064B|nr:protein enabled homolog [Sphaeramia orbicularis]XP_029987939.1 protein enabled homolog [Sphaeramia orbicularis]